MNERSTWARCRGYFITGLAVVLPVVISVAVVVWLFGTVTRFTDTLLFFLPRAWTHTQDGEGSAAWYWSAAALALAAFGIGLIGRATQHYIGRKLVAFMDTILLQVPLLNKVYGTLKQVNAAFSSSSKSSFKQVVLVEFPRAGLLSLGFITSDQHPEVTAKTGRNVVSVFVPTTPNPTTGFLLLLEEHQLVRLDMSVAEGIRFIISLGSISPEFGVRPPPGVRSIPGVVGGEPQPPA
jgi:uncharacterized membrane protein